MGEKRTVILTFGATDIQIKLLVLNLTVENEDLHSSNRRPILMLTDIHHKKYSAFIQCLFLQHLQFRVTFDNCSNMISLKRTISHSLLISELKFLFRNFFRVSYFDPKPLFHRNIEKGLFSSLGKENNSVLRVWFIFNMFFFFQLTYLI